MSECAQNLLAEVPGRWGIFYYDVSFFYIKTLTSDVVETVRAYRIVVFFVVPSDLMNNTSPLDVTQHKQIWNL